MTKISMLRMVQKMILNYWTYYSHLKTKRERLTSTFSRLSYNLTT